jgi:tripartite-type tricarboxylate transporter receptor subunit TctC
MIKRNEYSIASASATAPATFYAKLLAATYGAKLRIVTGYDGSPAAILAVERGEVDGTISGEATPALRSRIAPLVANGQLKVLLVMATDRDPAYPDAPTALELASSDRDKEALRVAYAPTILGQPFVAPPQTPPDRLQVLRRAFRETLRDPAFLADAKVQSAELNPVGARRMVQLINEVYATPEGIADYLRSFTR